MSLALFIVAEDHKYQNEVFVNGKCFADHYDHVGVLAKDKGLKHIDDFIVNILDENMAEELGLSVEDIKNNNAKLEKIWFKADEGLKYFEKVIEIVKKDGDTTDKTKNEVIPDLIEFINALKILKSKNVGWRFQWDY